MASPHLGEIASTSSAENGEEESKAEGGGDDRKEVLIGRILELQNTLHDLTQRVNSVKEENSKLKSENEVSYELSTNKYVLLPTMYDVQVLNQYIENLMVTSGTFKSTDGKK